MITQTFKIVSYCEIPEELTEHHHISEYSCGVYYPFDITFPDDREGFTDDFSLDDWLLKNYPQIPKGETILIDIDY